MMNHQQHMWGQQSLYSTPSGVPIPPLLSPKLYVGNLVYEVITIIIILIILIVIIILIIVIIIFMIFFMIIIIN